MTTAITPLRDYGDVIDQVVIAGDLAKLSPTDRVSYYRRVCESVGLNPLTQPFSYINLNGKLTLYARKDATDQLRKLYGVSLSIVGRDRLDDVYVVTARATLPDGRTDESTGVVTLGSLKGDNLANALMKAETKAKRRVTLSICGLGWLDESEMQSIADARPAHVDMQTGEIVDAPPVRPAKPEVTVEQAEAMYWDRFAPVLGGREWSLVVDLLGKPFRVPDTVEGWRDMWKWTDQALAEEVESRR